MKWLFPLFFLGTVAEARPIQVGSKAFTESVVLGEVLAELVRREGGEVEHRRELGGSSILWRATRTGEIDAYVEYSGTLTGELVPSLAGKRPEQWGETLASMGLVAGRSLGFEDKYALGMRRDRADSLRIRKLSDLRGHPNLRYGLTHEFLERREGWPAVRRVYELAPERVRGVQHVVAYQAVASDAIDVLDLYTTDAEISALDLVALEDDLRVFPDYEAFVLHREAVARTSEPLRRALAKLEGAIDAPAMIAMNRRVKMDKVPEALVAAEFVQARWGGERKAPMGRNQLARVWQRTREHLFLVGLAMLATILVAVPLGVVAARSTWLGAVLLGAAGILQTIPSLALLVFLIPLLGIGEAPALVALFVYGLLPVMRNTALGFQSIAPDVDESARALGLPSRARLLRIELPLATPAIVAGIKTAATLAVGTATLGALIGAGGYGQPILEGLRRDELSRTLEGAIPAALLALLVQAAFAVVERHWMPRGLRKRDEKGSHLGA